VALTVSGFLAALVSVGLVQLSPEPRSSTVVLLNGLLLGLCIFPGALWFIGSRRNVPAFEAICLAHAAYFGATGLLLPNRYVAHHTDAGRVITFTENELATTLIAVIAGVVALELGFLFFSISPLARRLPAVDVPLNARRMRVYLVVAVLGGLLLNEARAAGFAPSSDSPLGALIGVLGNQVTVAVAILAYLVFGGKARQPGFVVLLVIATLGAAFVGLTSSLVESAFLIPFVIGIIALQLRREVVLAILVGMAVSYLFFIQPVKLKYRTLLTQSLYDLTFIDRMALWYDATVSFLEPPDAIASAGAQDSGSAGLLETGRSSLDRLDDVHQFALVRLDTPELIPYYGGASYKYFAFGWIPRLVWPGKPSALEDNNRMIIDYGVLSERSQMVTTAGLGLIPEAFANFGDLGIVVVMAIQGVVLAAVSRAFTATGSVAANAVLISVLVLLVNGVGGITSVMYGGLLQNLAANALVVWLAAGRPEHIAQVLNRVPGMGRVIAYR
jgi:hypothetical protein